MPYRAVDLSDRLAEIEQGLQTAQLVLKLLPDIDNHTPKVSQLVRVNLYDVRLRGAWGGTSRAVHDPARRLPGRGASGRARARGPTASMGHDTERR